MLTEVTGVVSTKVDEQGTDGTGSFFTGSSLEGINFAEYADEDEDVAAEDPEDWNIGADTFDENWLESSDQGMSKERDAILSTQEDGLEWVVSSALGGKMGWAGPTHWQFRAPSRPKPSEHAIQIRLKIEFRESEARGSSIMTLKAQANLMKKDLNSLLTRMIYYWHRYQVLLTPYFHQIWVMKDQTLIKLFPNQECDKSRER